MEFVLVGGRGSWSCPERRGFPQHALLNCGRAGEWRWVAIETDLGLLDVVQGLDGVPPYAELHTSAVNTEILGVEVAVCSIDALRQMKQAADRPRDRVDIEDLDSTGN